ncbi:MAG: DUF5011 domain-containing protein [Bacteroidetes bacterium]|nr:DUF5011 domain-containing protein [Bacteroidota bacterium]
MKKLLAGILTIAIVVTILITPGCIKDDLSAPVIILLGENPLKMDLNADWTTVDPGATASDDEDGDLTAKIVVTNTPNVDLAGTYEVLYSVTDAAGNVGTAKRTVNVNNALMNMGGTYNVVDSLTSGSSSGSVYSYTDVISASATVNNRILVTKFAGYVDGSVHFDLNGANITIPSQQVNCGNPAALRTFIGNGTITGAVMTINYTETVGSTGVTGIETYTKQ